MIKRRTSSKIFGGQVWNTGGAIFSTGEAYAPPAKQLKMLWNNEIRLTPVTHYSTPSAVATAST